MIGGQFPPGTTTGFGGSARSAWGGTKGDANQGRVALEFLSQAGGFPGPPLTLPFPDEVVDRAQIPILGVAVVGSLVFPPCLLYFPQIGLGRFLKLCLGRCRA
jgi:hypothetical protein